MIICQHRASTRDCQACPGAASPTADTLMSCMTDSTLASHRCSDRLLCRHVLYTCYQPAVQATEADLAAKRHAYENYAITTHWPAANVTVGAPPSDEEREKYTLPRTRSRVGP